MKTLTERLKLVRKSLGYTQEQMGGILGIKKSAYSMIENGKANLTNRNKAVLIQQLNINEQWLDEEDGEMFTRNYLSRGRQNEIPAERHDFSLVPVYNMDVVGGYSNDLIDCAEYVSRYVPFINARDTDIAMPVTGNSMYPTYPAGSTVLLRRVETWRDYVEFGQVYVIILSDGRRILKEVRRCDDKDKRNSHVLCISHNPQYDPTELPIKLIIDMYIVKAVYYETTM